MKMQEERFIKLSSTEFLNKNCRIQCIDTIHELNKKYKNKLSEEEISRLWLQKCPCLEGCETAMEFFEALCFVEDGARKRKELGFKW